MIFLSTIVSGVKHVKAKLSRARAEPDRRQARTPLRKIAAAADPRPETEKLADAIDLHVGGVHVPFKVLTVRDKGRYKHVKIYAHTTADDGGDPDETKAESGQRTRIEVSLVTDKWWKDVIGEIVYVADGNCDDGGKVMYVLFCMVDPDDEVGEGEEEYVEVRHEFESEDIDPLLCLGE
ncbi:hypothetical protein CGRA01v4_11743 [Colletotrichum graminicola]|uniref:Uncharacterized protein n=1 Tax=Colletotrichum graminicola (strain M1.001 / M2 / FGSC 10212) TaxID=645133 RepID=E3QW48_COLGM|nr:uncharacterized protein GLRG_10230 [Colletotrichum graminicola M1.001]EFQ35086.1 hypothetical protein GLRG_10230 [Colletotrichum graminicola M1.001]WDK20456.1 hypothetical protein CGRA01v4_11743 [Colletotrichum graminicola]